MPLQEKNNFKWHFLSWSIYFLINYYHDIFYEEWNIHAAFYVIGQFAFTVANFYIFYKYVAPNFFKSYKFLYVILIILLIIISRYAFEYYIYPLFMGLRNIEIEESLWTFINDNLFKALIPSAAGSLLYLFEKSKRDEAHALKLLNEKNEAELSFLRSQINPHFLFNTMNFLYTKAFKLDEDLAGSILRLSDVLRYTLKSSASSKVKIQEEVDLITDFIEIFKERFAGQCFVELEITGDNFNHLFEPLVLLPFVENGFKHGVYNNPDDPILFNLEIKDKQLVFKVNNKIKHQKKDEVSGIGISNLKRRLDLLYPKSHSLDIKNDGDRYNAVLKIKL